MRTDGRIVALKRINQKTEGRNERGLFFNTDKMPNKALSNSPFIVLNAINDKYA